MVVKRGGRHPRSPTEGGDAAVRCVGLKEKEEVKKN